MNIFRSQIFEQRKTKRKSHEIKFEDRLSEVEFFNDDDFEEINSLTRRTRDMMGLRTNFVQPWQVTLYEVGGFFTEHSDIDFAVSRRQTESEKKSRPLVT